MSAKKPAEHYGTPAEVAAALQPFATGADLARLVATVPSGCITARVRHVHAVAGPLNADTKWKHRGRSPMRGRLALAGVCLALLAAVYFGLQFGRSPETSPHPEARIEEFRVNHFQGTQDTPVGDMRDSLQPIRVNDSVRVYDGRLADLLLLGRAEPGWDGATLPSRLGRGPSARGTRDETGACH